jgi:GT2 family glycosyltransferase
MLNVIVVDARPGETEAAVALVDTDFLRTRSQVITLEDNVGYARACNDGALWSALDPEVDTYVFFNADTELRPGVLESCLELLWSRDDYAVVGPRQVNRRGQITHAGIFGPHKGPQLRGWLTREGFEDVRDDLYSVSGSMYFIKRDVWDELAACPEYRQIDPDSEGAFLTTFLYHEETWCSVHALAHGYKIAYNGSVTAIHNWHGAIGQLESEGTFFKDSKARFVEACQAHGIEHN